LDNLGTKLRVAWVLLLDGHRHRGPAGAAGGEQIRAASLHENPATKFFTTPPRRLYLRKDVMSRAASGKSFECQMLTWQTTDFVFGLRRLGVGREQVAALLLRASPEFLASSGSRRRCAASPPMPWPATGDLTAWPCQRPAFEQHGEVGRDRAEPVGRRATLGD
jgi:hypothetical protein